MTDKLWIDVVPDGAAPADVQERYDRVRDSRGHVDHILLVHGIAPAALDAHDLTYRAAMRGTPDLSKAQREMIAVVVSVANGCHY